MIFGLKNKLLIIFATAMLLLGGLIALNYHQMPMNSDSSHADCNTTCKIACFSQAIGSFIAAPNLSNSFLFILPVIIAAYSALIVVVIAHRYANAFRYSLGPPLYKQLETYRI